MGQRTQVSGYVSEDEKQSFAAHAEAADMSLSKWVVEACREKVEREGMADQAQRYRIEQRLMALVDDAADRAADQITDEVLTALDEQGAVDDTDEYDDWGE